MKQRTKRKLISLIFPERCPYCRKVIEPCTIACKECREKFPDKVYKRTVKEDVCVFSALPYHPPFSHAVTRIKFGKRKQYAYQLAPLMVRCIKKELDNFNVDIVTSVPLHANTLKKRKFNQSELIAKEVCKLLNLEYAELLVKLKDTEPQHSLDAKAREKNLRGAFSVIDKELIKGKKILLIDDVVTTGNTIGECSKTLYKAGAEDILALTFAISLPKTT